MVFWRLLSPRAPGTPTSHGGDASAAPDHLHKIKKLLGAGTPGTRSAPSDEASSSGAPAELAQVAEFDEVMAAARACVEAIEEATSKLQTATSLLEDFVDKSYGKSFLGASSAKDILTQVHESMGQLRGALPHTQAVKEEVDEAGRRSAAAFEACAARDRARLAKEEAQGRYDHLKQHRKDYTLAQTQVIMGARAAASREYEDRAREAEASVERALAGRPRSTGAALAGVCGAYAALAAGHGGDLVERMERTAHQLSSGPASMPEAEGPGVPRDAPPAQRAASGPLAQAASPRSLPGSASKRPLPPPAETASGSGHPNATVESIRLVLKEAQAQDRKDPLAAHYCRTHSLEVLIRERMAGRSSPEAQELLYQALSQAEEKKKDLDLTNGPQRMEELALRSLAAVEQGLSGCGGPGEASTPLPQMQEELRVAEVLVQSLAQFSDGGALASEHAARLQRAREALGRRAAAEGEAPLQADRGMPSPVAAEGNATEEPAAEIGVETDSSSDFSVGEVVFMWSNSAGAWLPATVEQVFHEAGYFQQYAVAAGVVQLVCDSGTKFVHPSQFKEVIRKRRAAPRTAQCGG